MNYRGKKVAITGHSGFIGKALARALEPNLKDLTVKNLFTGANKPSELVLLRGDTRDPSTFSKLDHTFDYLFHFAAPSSQILFQRQPVYAADVTLKGFINAAKICQQNGIKLIYPSTGLLSSDQQNEYARCKKVCEDMHLNSGMDALGLRIFATYGPGEGHKRDYASVPYLFAREMVAGRRATVFGKGDQLRDFIYIDDVVEAILELAEGCNHKIVDVGSGVSTSFNYIVESVNKGLGEYIRPIYISQIPKGYVFETAADVSTLNAFYSPKVSLDEGIARVVKHLKEIK